MSARPATSPARARSRPVSQAPSTTSRSARLPTSVAASRATTASARSSPKVEAKSAVTVDLPTPPLRASTATKAQRPWIGVRARRACSIRHRSCAPGPGRMSPRLAIRTARRQPPEAGRRTASSSSKPGGTTRRAPMASLPPAEGDSSPAGENRSSGITSSSIAAMRHLTPLTVSETTSRPPGRRCSPPPRERREAGGKIGQGLAGDRGRRRLASQHPRRPPSAQRAWVRPLTPAHAALGAGIPAGPLAPQNGDQLDDLGRVASPGDHPGGALGPDPPTASAATATQAEGRSSLSPHQRPSSAPPAPALGAPAARAPRSHAALIDKATPIPSSRAVPVKRPRGQRPLPDPPLGSRPTLQARRPVGGQLRPIRQPPPADGAARHLLGQLVTRRSAGCQHPQLGRVDQHLPHRQHPSIASIAERTGDHRAQMDRQDLHLRRGPGFLAPAGDPEEERPERHLHLLGREPSLVQEVGERGPAEDRLDQLEQAPTPLQPGAQLRARGQLRRRQGQRAQQVAEPPLQLPPVLERLLSGSPPAGSPAPAGLRPAQQPGQPDRLSPDRVAVVGVPQLSRDAGHPLPAGRLVLRDPQLLEFHGPTVGP